MAEVETTSASAYQEDVELFRAVRAIPFARLKGIICTHYGPRHFDAVWRRVRDSGRYTDLHGNKNLCLYLGITSSLGRKDGAVGEILTVCKNTTGMESVNKDGDETPAPQETLAEPGRDLSPLGSATIEVTESDAEPEDAQGMSGYLEAFECNTTRSCCLEIGAIGCYDSEEDDSDEDRLEQRRQRGSSGCSSEERPDDQGSAMGAQVQFDATRGDDETVQRNILEDETVEKPKVIIDDD